MSYEGDSFVRHFGSHGAREIIVADNDHQIIRTTINKRKANYFVESILPLVAMARNAVRDLDPANDLTFLRMRSDENEILVSPTKDFIMIVIHNLNFKPRQRNY